MKKPASGKQYRMVLLFARSLRLIWEASPGLTSLTLAIVILTGLLPSVQVWISKLMIDRIASLLGRQAVTWATLILPLSLYVAVWIVGRVSAAVASGIHELASVRVRDHALYVILRKGAELDFAFFEAPAFYDRMSLAKGQVWLLENLVYEIATILTQAVTLVSMFLLLGSVAWGLPAVILLTSLPKLALVGRLRQKGAKLRTQRTSDLRLADYLGRLLSTRENAKEIRLFQLQDHLLERQDRIYQAYFREATKLNVANELILSMLTLVSVLGTAGAWVYASLRTLAAQATVGALVLVFQATEQSRSALDQVATVGSRMATYKVYLEALFGFLDLAPGTVDGALRRLGPDESAPLRVHTAGRAPVPDVHPIEFRDVSFRYPGSDRKAVEGVSFTLHPGEKVALVGENGAGKTTLVKLLARLYDPTEGVIFLGGRDLCEIDPEDHYGQVAVIFQNFARYELTARENIGFGDVAALEDGPRIERAAQKGGAKPLVEGLPRQYETPLGRLFEGGVDLSGGEWQKLALSRAFMREAALLILDEPTAALDAYAENEVYRRFATLTEGRTTLFVTHRLSSVRMADRILVLKDGRLIEEGTHDGLMRQDGEYAAMFTLQAEKYQEGRPIGISSASSNDLNASL